MHTKTNTKQKSVLRNVRPWIIAAIFIMLVTAYLSLPDCHICEIRQGVNVIKIELVLEHQIQDPRPMVLLHVYKNNELCEMQYVCGYKDEHIPIWYYFNMLYFTDYQLMKTNLNEIALVNRSNYKLYCEGNKSIDPVIYTSNRLETFIQMNLIHNDKGILDRLVTE